jgi:hypothetical protein
VKKVLVQLDGTGSADPDGDKLKYRWKQVSGPEVVLSGGGTAKPYFRTDLPGVYKFSLVVSDGAVESDPSVVAVTVARPNLRPEAILPKALKGILGRSILLDGRRSRDADGDALTYRFRQTAGTPLFLREEDCSASTLALTIEEAGIYQFELSVFDGKRWSQPATCQVTVSAPNKRPVARARAAQTIYLARPLEEAGGAVKGAPVAVVATKQIVVSVGQTVLLDGSRSYSGRKRALRYYWKQRGGPFVTALTQPEGQEAKRSFVPEQQGTYEFELVVSDGELDSAAQIVVVKVMKGNMPPVAVIRAPKRIAAGEKLVLDGSRSYDRESPKVSHAWKQTGGPKISSVGADVSGGSRAVYLPVKTGVYTFSLTVSDGQRESRPAEAVVVVGRGNALPTVKAVASLHVFEGERFLLAARGKDPEGAPLSYRWVQTEGPSLLDQPATQQQVQLRAVRAGTYCFVVTVYDGVHRSEAAETQVTVAAKRKRRR